MTDTSTVALAHTRGGLYLITPTDTGLTARKVSQLHTASTPPDDPEATKGVEAISWVGGERIISSCVTVSDIKPDTMLRLTSSSGVSTTSLLTAVALGHIVEEVEGDAIHIAYSGGTAWRIYRDRCLPLHDTDDQATRPTGDLTDHTIIRVVEEQDGELLPASALALQTSGRAVKHLPDCPIQAGVGWWQLAAECCAAMARIDPNVEFERIHQKYGELRIDYVLPRDTSDHIRAQLEALVQHARQESHTVCELCSQVGRLRVDDLGCITAACDDCADYFWRIRGWSYSDV